MSIYKKNNIVLLCVLCIVVASACSSSRPKYRDVWENYDVRDINNPNNPFGGGYYQDNDSYYTPPKSYGCSPADIGSIGCE